VSAVKSGTARVNRTYLRADIPRDIPHLDTARLSRLTTRTLLFFANQETIHFSMRLSTFRRGPLSRDDLCEMLHRDPLAMASPDNFPELRRKESTACQFSVPCSASAPEHSGQDLSTMLYISTKYRLSEIVCSKAIEEGKKRAIVDQVPTRRTTAAFEHNTFAARLNSQDAQH
jgi:hypothetical protein